MGRSASHFPRVGSGAHPAHARPPRRSQGEWAADLAPFPTDDDYISAMVAGVEEELGDETDFVDLLARRDAVLLRLLADKRANGALTIDPHVYRDEDQVRRSRSYAPPP